MKLFTFELLQQISVRFKRTISTFVLLSLLIAWRSLCRKFIVLPTFFLLKRKKKQQKKCAFTARLWYLFIELLSQYYTFCHNVYI